MSNPTAKGPGHPYRPPGMAGDSKKGGMSVVTILLIVFGVLAVGCVCCVGVGYLMFGQAMNFLGSEAAQIASRHQEVLDHFGHLEASDVSTNFMETGRVNQEDPDREYLVFDADGPLGSGRLIFRTTSNNTEPLELVRIEIDGQVIEIEH